MKLPVRFTARVVPGSGRGKHLGVPTFNLALEDIPKDLQEGIFAGSAEIDGKKYVAAIHYGPRPVFHDSETFEVHLVDSVLNESLETIIIFLKERLRDVKDFPSKEALAEQIQDDIEKTRAIMGSL